ncbi:MAG: replication initiator protein A, partial [Ruminococcus flavefaciens]|nr:replication initiator protein A [Ruminococcus flavefaciens]
MADNIKIPEHLYIHGTEIDQFLYIQVPVPLVKDNVFSSISDSAKILYGLLLNRMGLSISNGWMDENNRTYINYTIENVMDDFNCGSTKAKKLFAELVNVNNSGIGLIQKVSVLNKPSRIYVLNFMKVLQYLSELKRGENTQKPTDLLEGRKSDPRGDVIATHGGTQMRPTEGRDCDPRRDVNATTNYHYYNKHYYRDHYQSVNQEGSDTDVSHNMTDGRMD